MERYCTLLYGLQLLCKEPSHFIKDDEYQVVDLVVVDVIVDREGIVHGQTFLYRAYKESTDSAYYPWWNGTFRCSRHWHFEK